MAAIELRNFGYAISLLQGILKQEPQFLTGRQLLRRAEVAKQKAGKKRFFHISTRADRRHERTARDQKSTAARVEMIEKVLEGEPYNRQANLALKEAAVAAGWPEIGVFALQTLLEENPRDVKLLHELGLLIIRPVKATKRSRFTIESQRSIRSTPRRCDRERTHRREHR